MSKKLPNIRFIPRPEWQKKRLAEWLEEWNLDLALRAHTASKTPSENLPGFPGVGGALVGFASVPGLLSDLGRHFAPKTPPGISIFQPDSEVMQKLVRPFDRPVEVGQVRLLTSELTPDADRPVFVAVFGDWDEGAVLVAPFSPFSVPATTGEWLTGRSTPVLRVLEIWNTRTVPNVALEQSWLVDDFTNEECKAAWHVFEHEALGMALESEFEQQLGTPLVHPNDPRRQYQDQEFAILAKFHAFAKSIQDDTSEPQPDIDVRAHQDAFEDESEELMVLAASEKELLPEIVRLDDLLAGFQGEATGDGCTPSKASTLRLAITAPELPRPTELPVGGVIIVWPTGQTKPCDFTHRSGKWRVNIRLPLPWPEMVALLLEKKIRIEPVG